ncbi:hypothetical protein OJAV_G00092720 [Oryzias javanicus]|uniref:Uncharacterized protein n=1 Tax=Oryzias javanicus TaxID=123683 RepID=A0A3S2MJV4_ORYJA|nr:hypothetical protein OJAV_G00092720 [Oryzias javanicus]
MRSRAWNPAGKKISECAPLTTLESLPLGWSANRRAQTDWDPREAAQTWAKEDCYKDCQRLKAGEDANGIH